ncbi:MAG: aminoacyl-histidine dipeptidase [Bacteroidales bacterium]|nr:aminoacyl-histidine dipeptidase [Bacteroidales bacterium]
MDISHLDPQRVWKHFYALTQIPRPSKKEGKAVEFLENFGKSLSLETVRDHIGNIIIYKPATPGMENRKGIVLQGHMDMVPQKNADKVHDFEKDPIEPRIVEQDGEEWVYATGTTLGADNGLGVATAMAILEAKDLQHGPITALFTVDEETGMTGAFNLDAHLLRGDILINLDSETEGEIYVGCAGGMDGNVTFNYTEEPIPAGYEALKLSVKGLRGGHSGMEIHEGRGNANKIISRVLVPIFRDFGGKLVSIEGGTLRNAIPREAFAVIAVPASEVDAVKGLVEKIDRDIMAEIGSIDPKVKISIEPALADKVMAGDIALRLARALHACPNDVERMSTDMPGLVETSNNLAIVKSENGEINVKCLVRSSVDTAKVNMADAFRDIFELAGATVVFTGGYSGWKPNMESPILHEMKKVYKNMYGNEPAVMAIHAGLECGIIGAKYPNLDMVSVGPTLCSPHSPDERVLVKTVAKFWNFIVEVLKEVPEK